MRFSPRATATPGRPERVRLLAPRSDLRCGLHARSRDAAPPAGQQGEQRPGHGYPRARSCIRHAHAGPTWTAVPAACCICVPWRSRHAQGALLSLTGEVRAGLRRMASDHASPWRRPHPPWRGTRPPGGGAARGTGVSAAPRARDSAADLESAWRRDAPALSAGTVSTSPDPNRRSHDGERARADAFRLPETHDGDQGVAMPAILERCSSGARRSPDAVPGGAVAAPQVTVLRWWRGPQPRPTAGETLSRVTIGAGTVRPQW